MKKIMITAIAATTLLSTPYAATAKSDEPARPEHYMAKTPNDVATAVAWLNDGAKDARVELGKNNLEAIHEESYTMEASVDKLRAYIDELEKALDEVDESVQIIHHSAENGKKAIVSQQLPKLEVQVKKLQKVVDDKPYS